MNTAKNPAGGDVLACDLDDNCMDVDCETCLEEIPASLSEHSEAPDYMTHYCGLACTEKWREQQQKEEEKGS